MVATEVPGVRCQVSLYRTVLAGLAGCHYYDAPRGVSYLEVLDRCTQVVSFGSGSRLESPWSIESKSSELAETEPR
jgi:hypothetical protein